VAIDDILSFPFSSPDANLIDFVTYQGDQGLISLLFAGDIKFFGHPEPGDYLYMPYNFDMHFFELEDKPPYEPKVIHYARNLGEFPCKPWWSRLSGPEDGRGDFYHDEKPFSLKPEELRFYELWWDYCRLTPIFEDSYAAAGIYAREEETGLLRWVKRYHTIK
jgi:hypothetical protein